MARSKGKTLDWYVKWVASVIVLGAMSVRGIPEFQLIDLMLSIVGISLWLWVSILWEDRALILLNGAGLILLINNLAKYMLEHDFVVKVIGWII